MDTVIDNALATETISNLLRQRVFSSLKADHTFTAREMELYGSQIRELRKERKEQLKNMSIAEVTAAVTSMTERGFYVASIVEKNLKSKDVCTISFDRTKGDAGAKSKAAKLAAENDELKARLASLEAMLAKISK